MNNNTASRLLRSGFFTGCLVILALAAVLPAQWSQSGPAWWRVAQADESGHDAGHAGGHGGGEAGHGGGHSGADDSDHESGHDPGPRGYGSQGTHRGGHGHDVARGAAKAVEYRVFGGGRPVWAQGGIPEVELGRLNVSRAPPRVLARAELEAVTTYSPAMAELYSLDAAQAAALLSSRFSDVVRYDSPVQNLALYKDVMTFGTSRLASLDPSLTPSSQLDLAAIFLGSAADKSIPISPDTVIAVNRILGLVELDAAGLSELAGKADMVRTSILEGHGPVEETH